MEKDGYSFFVMSADETRRRLAELRAVSDQWLAAKKAKEKGFSLGFFDEAYLSRFPCAVVAKNDGIVAFANIWSCGSQKEASVDLMRHTADAPNGTMEYLFTRTIEWARDNGYGRFNLGMAPFSGLEARDAAPFWNKAVSLIFKTGEGIYNFQGLRSFKAKFHPNWYPRYIASGGGGSLPVVSADIALLISKGKRIAAGGTPPHAKR
jgi:phosphatidylglycerol lysyltransferase